MSRNKIKFRHSFVSAQVFGLPSSTGPLGFPNKVCDKEKNGFSEDLDGLIESISTEERIVLGADLNGHVDEGNIGDEEIMERYGAETRNKEGSMVWILGKGWIWRLSILILRRKMNAG